MAGARAAAACRAIGSLLKTVLAKGDLSMTDILLVDDSPVDLRLFSELLGQEKDFAVRTCEDGNAALRAMGVEVPDIVVTDMQMPVMDGLELVKHVRAKYPNTPIILITGFGSEEIATKALRAGAAGYVPKSNSAESLCSTIRHVLELGRTFKIEDRVNASTRLLQYELELENDETLIPGVLQLARQRVQDVSEVDCVNLLQIEAALEHALMNAIYHGNLDFKQHAGIEFDARSRTREARILNGRPPYKDRRVSVIMRVTPDEARFVVKDEGSGFDVKEVSSLGLTQSLRGEFGQGLFLMWAFMDKVVFDRKGSAVTLVKQLDKPAPPVEDEPKQEALVALHYKGGQKSYTITKPRATIGRDDSCDVVVDSGNVSHHHCLLFLHEGWWFVRDLKSTNGIKVNGVKRDSHLLPPAAILSVGPHEFTVEYQPHKLGAVGITPPVDPF